MNVRRSLWQELDVHGFAIVDRVVDARTLDELRTEADLAAAAAKSRGGARNLLQRSAALRETAENGPVVELARKLIGRNARPTKLTLFDKTSDANWKIRWHQDVTIAVRERIDIEGFDGWSEKESVVHVRAPAEVLASVLALRLHLDDTPTENGALRVVPGSHLSGRLSQTEIRRFVDSRTENFCEVAAGGVMVMRPLLLHASAVATQPSHRRVLHFEYCAEDLPGGLEWI